MTAPRDVSSWLPTQLGPVDLQANGEAWPSRRKIWNFTGGVTVTDHPNDEDPMLSYTEIAISGEGGTAEGPTLANASTGTLNNVVSTSSGTPAAAIRFEGAAPSVTGIASGADKRKLVLFATGGPLVLVNESASSSAVNRIVTGTGESVTVPEGGAVLLSYDPTSLRWRIAGASGLPAGWSSLADGRLHARQVRVVGAPLLTFATAGDTITRDAGSWVTDGFEIGHPIIVDGSVSNDGTYTVTNVTALVLTVAENLVNEGPVGSVDVVVQPAYLTAGLVGATYPSDGLIRIAAEDVAMDVITQRDGVSDRTVLRVSAGAIQLGAGVSTGAGVVRIYGGDGVTIESGTGFFNLNGDVEQNGNLALLGPVQSGNWQGGFRVGYLYGVNAGVTAPTSNPTNGIFFWCRDDNQSSAVKAVYWLYPDGVKKIHGGKRSEHQQGLGKIIPLVGQVQTSSTSPAVITGLEYTQPDETVCTYVFSVDMARQTNVTKAGHYEGRVTYRRTGGGAPTLVGAAVYPTDQETTAGDGVAFTVSSNTIRASATAADSDGRTWFGEMRVSQVAAA